MKLVVDMEQDGVNIFSSLGGGAAVRALDAVLMFPVFDSWIIPFYLNFFTFVEPKDDPFVCNLYIKLSPGFICW